MSAAAKSPEKKSAFLKRLVSGLILAPLSILIIVFGGFPYSVLIFCGALLALYEFLKLIYEAPHHFLHVVFGLFYIALAAASLFLLRFALPDGVWCVLTPMICVWASDIGAYVVGKTLKGPKMTPKLSPNKTWAGLAGAMIFFALALCVMVVMAPEGVYKQIEFEMLPLFLIGLVFGLISQAGDLLISFYKRRVNAKDTGTLIPGHGGLLDRIDALLLVSPAFLVFLVLCL